MYIATSLFVFVLPQNRPRTNRKCLEEALYKRKLAILPCIVLLGGLPVNRNLQQVSTDIRNVPLLTTLEVSLFS
jgi:hypothetical protein